MYKLNQIKEATQVKSAIVIELVCGEKVGLFVDSKEDAKWLSWEINDCVAMNDEDLFECAMIETNARWGGKTK